ncbi:uncharacterized protein LOC126829782 [Patella vulgata]|uniref:uncharacterized protein LOC126829782 n=1 Tax=Patella vulgata TaxID=6465 RepID=UPI0024A7F4D1|nr:uncharacterized protein LOC126829782 [Patella vulgata]
MELLHLPKELQFHIISRLDGFSLLNVQKVCKLWLEIVESLETTVQIWKQCCLNDIPRNILVQLTGITELMNNREIKESTNLHWTFWKEIYLDYERMSLIRDYQPKTTQVMFTTQLSACTSLRLKDNILVSGHTDGSVVLWDTDDQGQGYFKFLTKHRSHVTAVDVLNTVENMRDIDDWVLGYKVISVSRDVGIHVNNPLTNAVQRFVHYSGSVNAVSCYGGRFVVAADSSILNGQPIWQVSESNSVDTRVTSTLYGHEESCISAVAMWNGEVLSGDVIGNLFKWKIPLDGSDCSKPIHIAKFSVSYTKAIYYDGHVIFCLLGDGSICWRVGSSKFQTLPNTQELEVFSATPVCMACRARLLAIGLNSGIND